MWYVCTVALRIFSWHRMHSVVDFPRDNDNSNLAQFCLAWYLIQLVFKGPTNMPMKQWILIIILHKGIIIEKSTYRGILNKSFGTSSEQFCGAILWDLGRISLMVRFWRSFCLNWAQNQVISATVKDSFNVIHVHFINKWQYIIEHLGNVSIFSYIFTNLDGQLLKKYTEQLLGEGALDKHSK